MKDINTIRDDFPILKKIIHGDKPLVYLDNAATSQIPTQVMDAVVDFEFNHRANVHRGAHYLSQQATNMFEESRRKVAKFINAVVPEEIVFTKNSTEALNTVAFSWAQNNLKKGDIILVSDGEHHSNLIPWQIVAQKTGAEIVAAPIDVDGFIDIKSVNVDWLRIKLVSMVQVSNLLGSINDIKEIRKFIKKRILELDPKATMPRFVADISQSVSHFKVDVQQLGIDFAAFSGHKMLGPMGIGVLWVNREVFSELGVYLSGGGMIDVVETTKSTYAKMPEFLEAGTPNVTGVVGLAAAIDYIESIGFSAIQEHEKSLCKYFLERISEYKDIVLIGSKDLEQKVGVFSFNIKGVSAHDVAVVLDTQGVAVRSGHHCVMPWHMRNDQKTSCRASFSMYTTKDDLDAFFKGLDYAVKLLKK